MVPSFRIVLGIEHEAIHRGMDDFLLNTIDASEHGSIADRQVRSVDDLC